MTEKEMKKVQWVGHYANGLMDGVAGRSLYGKQYHKEYLQGHNDGVLFFRNMMDKARTRLDVRLYSEITD